MEYYKDSPVPISQYKAEFTDLLKLFKAANPVRILEIGTHYGGTLYQWLKHSDPFSLVVAVDTYHINENLYKEWKEPSQSLITIKGNSQSQGTINAVSEYAPFDFIFIDGDHSYDGVKLDWINYNRFLERTKNSLVVFHDIIEHDHAEVNKLWNEIKEKYIFWEFFESEKQDGCGIGVLLIGQDRI